MTLTLTRRRRWLAAIAGFLAAVLLLGLGAAAAGAAAGSGGVVGGLISTVAATADGATGHEVLPLPTPPGPPEAEPSEGSAPSASAPPETQQPAEASQAGASAPGGSARTSTSSHGAPVLAGRGGPVHTPAPARRDSRPAPTAVTSTRQVLDARVARPSTQALTRVAGFVLSAAQRAASGLPGGAAVEAVLGSARGAVEALPGEAETMLAGAGGAVEGLLGGALPEAIIPGATAPAVQALTTRIPGTTLLGSTPPAATPGAPAATGLLAAPAAGAVAEPVRAGRPALRSPLAGAQEPPLDRAIAGPGAYRPIVVAGAPVASSSSSSSSSSAPVPHVPGPGGVPASAVGAAAAAAGLTLALAWLLALCPPAPGRRLRASAGNCLTAPFELIPARPG